jgi:hypothetical protein
VHALLHATLNSSHIQVLAIGFLLVILSAALFKNYLTLLVVATYVIAPLPNWICGRASNPDDFMESSGSGVIDLGRFLTGFLVVMGVGTYSPDTPSDTPPSAYAATDMHMYSQYAFGKMGGRWSCLEM